ncbi:MAG: glycosyltransferase [Dehalococcoidia bacterium]
MSVARLRIAMLSAHSCPVGKLGTRDTGGMSVYIREIAREMGSRGHPVDIYTRVHDPHDRVIYELGHNARLIHLRAGEDEEIDKLAVYSHLPDFVENLEIFREQADMQYDLIFSHYWLSALAGAHLHQRWHVPHVTMFHTLGALKNAIREGADPAAGEPEPALRVDTERDLVQRCHRIIASTRTGQEELVRYCGAPREKISVVPCGVNLEQFRILDRAQARRHLQLGDGRVALFVGRIDPLKGIDKLIQALPHLGDVPGLRLVVIGGDEDSRQELAQLRQLASHLELEDAVSFAGLVKHEQLPYYYNAADICVVPSYYESFGLVALESLACGTPVVATGVGGHREIIREGEAGYVVAENDPRTLASKMALLLSGPDADTESRRRIRASVSRFSWSNIADRIISDCRLVVANYRGEHRQTSAQTWGRPLTRPI